MNVLSLRDNCRLSQAFFAVEPGPRLTRQNAIYGGKPPDGHVPPA